MFIIVPSRVHALCVAEWSGHYYHCYVSSFFLPLFSLSFSLLSLSSLSLLSPCLLFSQNDFTQDSEFLHASLYWPKKIKMGGGKSFEFVFKVFGGKQNVGTGQWLGLTGKHTMQWQTALFITAVEFTRTCFYWTDPGDTWAWQGWSWYWILIMNQSHKSLCWIFI